MKPSRLKNIVIVILVLVNVFLLALLAGRGVQERAARRRAVSQLIALYDAGGVSLPARLIPSEEPHPAPIDPTRSPETEAAFAAALLGPCEAEDVGGGIYRYRGENGTCLIRASGAVEAELALPAEDPEAFFEGLFGAFGYAVLASDVQDGSGAVTGVRMLPDGMVFNAQLTLDFSGGSLTSVSGSFVPPVDPLDGTGGIDSVTALVRFLDYSRDSGEVCTAVSGVRSGYLLQSTASASQRLIPAWCIETDTNRYYVNITTGEVTRET